jgi:NAD+ kinase
MTHPVEPPKSVALMAHPNIPDAMHVAEQVSTFLRDKGLETKTGSLYDEDLRKSVESREFDLLIGLGGDGTMLRSGHLCAPADVPLLGVNIGHFGFLAELTRENWRDMLPKLLSGDFRYEQRLMLSARCIINGEEAGVYDAINDVVVARGSYVRPIEVEALLNGAHITSYIADGLIAATATGSTAYALAAGGPILPPEIRNILLMPVAPHLSVDRAVVLSEGASVFIRVKTAHEAVVSVDGQDPVHLSSGDGVQINAHKKSLYMIRFEDPYYFYRNLTSYMEHNPIFSIKSDDQST